MPRRSPARCRLALHRRPASPPPPGHPPTHHPPTQARDLLRHGRVEHTQGQLCLRPAGGRHRHGVGRGSAHRRGARLPRQLRVRDGAARSMGAGWAPRLACMLVGRACQQPALPAACAAHTWQQAAHRQRLPPAPRSKCKEIRCKPLNFKDGYGERLDRSSVCYDPEASVVVMITDTCERARPHAHATRCATQTAPSSRGSSCLLHPAGVHSVRSRRAGVNPRATAHTLFKTQQAPATILAMPTATNAGAAATSTTCERVDGSHLRALGLARLELECALQPCRANGGHGLRSLLLSP